MAGGLETYAIVQSMLTCMEVDRRRHLERLRVLLG